MNDAGDEKPIKKRKRVRRWWVWLLLLVGLGWWVNGPGFRMIASWFAIRTAGKAGVELVFDLRGTLVGGATVHGLKANFEKGPLRSLNIGDIEPKYRLRDLLNRRIQRIDLRGVDVDVILEPSEEPSEGKAREPMDFAAVKDSLRRGRELMVTVDFAVSEITATIRGDGIERIEVESSSIRHEGGNGEIEIELGAVIRDGEVIFAGQPLRIDWTEDQLAVGEVVVHPEVRLENLTISHPLEGAMFLAGDVRVADAVVALSASPESWTLGLHLREGELSAGRVGELLGMELPVEGTLTSLALDAADFQPDALAATGTLSLLVENVRWGDFPEVDELGLDVILETDDVRSVLRATVGEAEMRMDASTTLDRVVLRPGVTRGRVEVPSVGDWAGVFERGEGVPTAEAGVDFSLDWDGGFAPASAEVSLRISPEDVELVTPLEVRAAWVKDEPLAVDLVADGLNANADLDLEARTYAGRMGMDGFDSGRIAAWLVPVNVVLPGRAKVHAQWSGTGAFGAEPHVGELSLVEGLWMQPELADVAATGDVEYAWPGRVELRELGVTRDGQRVEADVVFSNNLLEIGRLKLTDADGVGLAEVAGSVPVPEDLAAWREFIRDDTRPLDLKIRTEAMTFGKIATWVPALEQVDARATAEFDLTLTGNFAEPVVDASLAIQGLSVPERPELPAADVAISARGGEGVLDVAGTILSPGYDAVRLTAKLPFAPAVWMEDVDVLMDSPLEARAVLPRVDLARFSAMAPGLERLAGMLNGEVRVSGTVGEPVLDGQLDLTNGALALRSAVMPPVEDIQGNVGFSADEVQLRTLRATVAGGTVVADGAFGIREKTLDFRIRGNSLPLRRDENVIIRANADLRVAGTMDAAKISGGVSLVDSLFYRDIEIIPLGMPFTGATAAALPKFDAAAPTAGIPEPFSAWALDVAFSTEEPVLIRGNLATGRVLADVKIGGTLGDPRPDGQVRLLRGRAVLPFSTLAVPEAVLTFTPANRLDPVIEARGTAEPRPYVVNLFAYGRLSDPQIVLSSIPPLPQNEIMTLLATGTTTKGLEDPSVASARALQLLGEEIRRGRVPLSNQLRPLLGLLDRVDFTLAETDPYSSDTFSTATLKLHDRWYISAGMGQEGNTRMMGIWRLRFR